MRFFIVLFMVAAPFAGTVFGPALIVALAGWMVIESERARERVQQRQPE